MAIHTPLLDIVDMPEQLRQLSRKQLPQLATELREFLVESVSQTGGHLSSNLGVVEHIMFLTLQKTVWYGM
ncbi:MAG: 1-deoxyxylulose-5-phosphate synthase, thiamine-requiring, FAD-requiring [Pseudomonadota bacterium]